MASIYEYLHDDMELNLYEKPTEEDYKIAEANGISRINVYKRVHDFGYTIQEAITIRKGGKKDRKNKDAYEHWQEVCKANGISFKTFESRVRKGMKYDVAATKKPRLYPKQLIKRRLTNNPDKVIGFIRGVTYAATVMKENGQDIEQLLKNSGITIEDIINHAEKHDLELLGLSKENG